MKKLYIVLFLVIQLGLAARAQPPVTYSSSDIFLQLKKLNVLGSVLYVAAHPDDENTRLLAYLAKEKLYRTGYLSITRGDGGQNLIGDEQGIELGLIRTQELLAARRIDGAEQFFTRAFDFGYSKSADETMRIWDKEKVLADVVWVIRTFRPDVIITRFPADERAGHGHHTASAMLANEAFAAAADRDRFPEQFKLGVRPWKAERIMWNSFNFGGNNTTSNDQFKVDVGAYNPLLGKGYGEIASESRSQHKSQGFGVARQRGRQIEFFTGTGGSEPTNDLLDGVQTGWNRIEGGAGIEQKVHGILAGFSFQQPEKSVPALVELYHLLQAMPPGFWRDIKLKETAQMIVACGGLFAEAVTPFPVAVQGDSLAVNFILNSRTDVPAKLISVSLIDAGFLLNEAKEAALKGDVEERKQSLHKNGKQPSLLDSVFNRALPSNQNFTVPYVLKLQWDAPISQPYWLQKGLRGGHFVLPDAMLAGRADNYPSFVARYRLDIQGAEIIFDRPLQYKRTEPVKGELYQPLVVVPKVIVSVKPNVALTNVVPSVPQQLSINYLSNINRTAVPASLMLSNGGETNLFTRQLDLQKGTSAGVTYLLQQREFKNTLFPLLRVDLGGRQEKMQFNHRTISYDHIPDIHYFFRDTIKVIDAEVKMVGKKIGYIAGAGDRVPEALRLMGYQVSLLTVEEITEARLKQFDAVITGVRAYNVHENLTTKHNELMKYVKNGGNLIVQYNTNSNVGPFRGKISPYSFNIIRSRVSDERSPVTFSIPQHPVLNYPNKLTPKDFENWVQERSIYHADVADSNYVMPLLMNDPGEKPTGGALVIAPYGRGNFVYTGLVFFRQLPAGVAGAYRLMANLIALPKNAATAKTKKP